MESAGEAKFILTWLETTPQLKNLIGISEEESRPDSLYTHLVLQLYTAELHWTVQFTGMCSPDHAHISPG
jgi:hypothetical protein